MVVVAADIHRAETDRLMEMRRVEEVLMTIPLVEPVGLMGTPVGIVTVVTMDRVQVAEQEALARWELREALLTMVVQVEQPHLIQYQVGP
jgi:hypothetical protein